MKRMLLIALTALVMGACAQDKTEAVALNDGQIIYATIADMEGSGRVQLNENKQTVWTAGDRLVVYSATEMAEYEFMGNTGERSGSFQRLGYYSTVDMSVYNIPDNQWWAVYSSANRYRPGSLSTNVGTVVYFLLDIPNTSNYIKGSYGLTTNAMLGSSNDGQNFTFINLYGYLRISAVGSQKVTRVTLRSLTGEVMLAGAFAVAPDYPSAMLTFEGDATAVPYQVIECPEGVQLSDTPTDFYFALKPMSIEGGINVTFTFEDGSTYTKSTSKTIPVKRNTIQPMTVVDTDQASASQVAYITYMSKYITAPRVNPSNVATGSINWGDGTVTSINDLVHYYYYDDEPSHTVTVTVENGDVLQLDKCSGVTKIDLSNF